MPVGFFRKDIGDVFVFCRDDYTSCESHVESQTKHPLSNVKQP